jgi:hypothetical protein
MPLINNPGLFSDLGKRLTDLLTKEFPSEKQENKVAWKATTSNNVSVESNVTQRKDGSLVGNLLQKYKHKDWNTTFSVDVNTRKEVQAEIVAEDVVKVDGLKGTVTVNHKPSETSATAKLQYQTNNASAGASVILGQPLGTTVKGELVFGSQGFAIGGFADYLFGGESELRELKTVGSYSNSEVELTLFGRILNQSDEDKSELGLTYHHKVTSDTKVGAEVTYDTANSEAKPKLTFGVEHNLHQDTTLKGKIDTAGKAGFSIQQKHNKNAKTTVSLTTDINTFGGKNSSVFGFSLNLSD